MSRLINPVSVRPDELKPGDVMVATVTFHVTRLHKGHPVVAAYRCGYPPELYEEIPQGVSIDRGHLHVLAEALAPVELGKLLFYGGLK